MILQVSLSDLVDSYFILLFDELWFIRYVCFLMLLAFLLTIIYLNFFLVSLADAYCADHWWNKCLWCNIQIHGIHWFHCWKFVSKCVHVYVLLICCLEVTFCLYAYFFLPWRWKKGWHCVIWLLKREAKMGLSLQTKLLSITLRYRKFLEKLGYIVN